MCGRYTLSTPGEQLAQVFGLEESVELAPRFNIAPTQIAAIVRCGPEGGSTVLELFRWGLVPSWAKDPSIGNRMINARAETVEKRPAFKQAFGHRRCLIPADGFYEWRQVGRVKQPYYFSRPDGQPFALAGLWERWTGEEPPLRSFTLITTEANDTVAPIHHRMPVILDHQDWAEWLAAEPADTATLKALLRPESPERLVRWPVSRRVNSPANDSVLCVARAEELADEAAGEGQRDPHGQPGLF
jgi:putative SOS response-associated peptidase YedK